MPTSVEAVTLSHRPVPGTRTEATPDTPPARRLTEVRVLRPTEAAQATSWSSSSRGEAHGAGLPRRHLARVPATEEAHQVALVGGGDRSRLGDRGLRLEGQHREGEAAEDDQRPHRRELRQEEEPGPPAPPPGQARPDAEEDPGRGQQELERAGHREARAGAESQGRQDERDADRRQGDAEGARETSLPVGQREHREEAQRGEAQGLQADPDEQAFDDGEDAGRRPQVEQRRSPQEPGGHVPERRPEEGGIGQQAEGGDEVGERQAFQSSPAGPAGRAGA